MRDWAAELVERARSEGVELTGDNGLLTALVRHVLQTGLEVEMTDHLGYEPHAAPSSLRSTTRRSRRHRASFAGLGRSARRCAPRSARRARYFLRPPLAFTSRQTVDGDRPSS
jgi:transposase-like protein